MSCHYEIDEIFNEAVMTGIPSLIVEGIDDVTIYSDICHNNKFKAEVYAIEHIDGYGEGCIHVINAIDALSQIKSEDHSLEKHILGVIDKDVRDFRAEIPNLAALLVLKYYSIESHFISTSVIDHTLKMCSKLEKSYIDDELCTLIIKNIEHKIAELYYCYLESLKASIEPGYQASCSYSFHLGRIMTDEVNHAVLLKKDELDAFATSINISNNSSDIKKIAKGKWLIDLFSSELVSIMDNLRGSCKEHKIKTCKSCLNSAFDKCFYRIKDGITKSTIKSIALSSTVGDEFSYIANRIASLHGAK